MVKLIKSIRLALNNRQYFAHCPFKKVGDERMSIVTVLTLKRVILICLLCIKGQLSLIYTLKLL